MKFLHFGEIAIIIFAQTILHLQYILGKLCSIAILIIQCHIDRIHAKYLKIQYFTKNSPHIRGSIVATEVEPECVESAGHVEVLLQRKGHAEKRLL